MTFEEVIEKHKPFVNQEDYMQDCWLMKLENPDMDDNEICIKCRKKYINENLLQKHTIAQSIYNEDGDCLDDDLYFVDERTVEHNDFSYFEDDVKEKAKEKVEKISRIINLAGQILFPFGIVNLNGTQLRERKFTATSYVDEVNKRYFFDIKNRSDINYYFGRMVRYDRFK